MRASGILLPVSSLPGKYGIGCFSKEAYNFVDFLSKSGTRYWQILPLGQTSYGDSPYQSFSTFAGNPYFIDPEQLIEAGLLKKTDCDKTDFGDDDESVDYGKMFTARYTLLRKAFKKADRSGQMYSDADFTKFKKRNVAWLGDYALFMALKDAHGGAPWNEWEDPLRLRDEAALKEACEQYEKDIAFYSWLQYLFFSQWKKLKKYANKAGVKIIGDIPIYVSFDSADAWASPELFWFDKDNRPVCVAGCPPDAFTAEGQLWGNPLYDWDYHKKTGYEWWIERMRACTKLYDMVRIDHFRGFDEYYTIPYGSKNAVTGEWKSGPGYKLFEAIKRELGDIKVIVEDLGFITDSVRKLVKKTGWPNMKVLEFGFGDDTGRNEYLPCNYDKNCVVYTGTHDNDTLIGFINSLPPENLSIVRRYFDAKTAKPAVLAKKMIRCAYESSAKLCVIPMADFLGLDSTARINIPSTLGINWKWRMAEDALTDELAESIYELNRIYGRMKIKKKKVQEQEDEE